MKSVTTKNVVFITGAFVASTGWSEWETYFQSKGFNTVAPAWPFKNGTAAALRNR